MAAEFMLGLKPVAMVIFVGVTTGESVDAAGLAEVVADIVEAGVPLSGVALVDVPGLALDAAIVSVDGSVADVDEPHAATMTLTQSNTAINTGLRIKSPFDVNVSSSALDTPAAEYHRNRKSRAERQSAHGAVGRAFGAFCVRAERVPWGTDDIVR
jgi:ATP phosphoribosyltransferase